MDQHIIIPESTELLFKRAYDYLWSHSFIVKEKEPELFRFLSQNANLTNMNDYLGITGYSVEVDTDIGVACLKSADESLERRKTQLSFEVQESQLLIVLAKLYFEAYDTGITSCKITIKDLIDQIHLFEIKGPTTKPNWLKDAIRKFRKYQFIDCDTKIIESKKDRHISEESVITLLPTIIFLLDTKQFKENVTSLSDIYLKSNQEERDLSLEQTLETELETEDDEGEE